MAPFCHLKWNVAEWKREEKGQLMLWNTSVKQAKCMYDCQWICVNLYDLTTEETTNSEKGDLNFSQLLQNESDLSQKDLYLLGQGKKPFGK